ncbi:protein adenylyltransferase SelO, mitochondrial isoform X1 [Octopus sinensis]|uniref:Selenoprotein O n=1 Tax=Octopus sinensis TaxID=2607531 RepID=A0A6P7TB04_9MOLL|nr:protein adenylyltransferase SelO, mitochondrial isoform X1 [Octopus sinensis]
MFGRCLTRLRPIRNVRICFLSKTEPCYCCLSQEQDPAAAKTCPFVSLNTIKSLHTAIAYFCSCQPQKELRMRQLNFDNQALKCLPFDPSDDVKTQRPVPNACFSKAQPTPVENPVMVAYSSSALALLGLSVEDIETNEAVEYFSGNKIMKGSEPAAHCYCGYQFGLFSGQLGDGAAMYLGEVINDKSERWEIQLKGAGLTPFSRGADGRKVLRSSIREFLCSEAFHYLGIPTTRAGTCITSDSTVVRDIFYSGNPIHEKCTIVLRIAPTFLRFGSFEIFKEEDDLTKRSGPSTGNKELLFQLLDYSVKSFYPEIWSEHQNDKQQMYLNFYKEIVKRTAKLVAAWQCVGWCHGVLNTDNMSILGLTVDYGPFGFMDRFNDDFICNSSDGEGRYSYSKQPEICKWNCRKLAEDIQEAVPLDKTLPELENIFDKTFNDEYFGMMKKKLGFQKDHKELNNIVKDLLKTMSSTGADFTNTFRFLSKLAVPGGEGNGLDEALEYLVSNCSTIEELKADCQLRVNSRDFNLILAIAQTNPDILTQLGPEVRKVFKELERIENARKLADRSQEEKEQSDKTEWKAWLEQYLQLLQTEASEEDDLEGFCKKRVHLMNSVNPRFVLRNYIAENAIKAAEGGDFFEVRRVYSLLQNPYTDSTEVDEVSTNRLDISSNTDNTDQASSSCEGAVAAAAAAAGLEDSSVYSSSGFSYDCKPPSWAYDIRVS